MCCGNIGGRQWLRRAENPDQAESPSAASSARTENVRLENSFRTQPFGRRNFSWQPWQDAPSAGKAALKDASSVAAFTASLAFTYAIAGRFEASLVGPDFVLGVGLRPRRQPSCPRPTSRPSRRRRLFVRPSHGIDRGLVERLLALDHRHHHAHHLAIGLHAGLARFDRTHLRHRRRRKSQRHGARCYNPYNTLGHHKPATSAL